MVIGLDCVMSVCRVIDALESKGKKWKNPRRHEQRQPLDNYKYRSVAKHKTKTRTTEMGSIGPMIPPVHPQLKIQSISKEAWTACRTYLVY